MEKLKFIGFNKPYISEKEKKNLEIVLKNKSFSGNGFFTKKCQEFFELNFGFRQNLLTSSCTDALEMTSLLLNIQPGDEVIVPSFTFVSTANAYVLRGANIVFCDSRTDHPGMDEEKLETLIKPKTKAIVAVHYAGVACDMHKILAIAKKHNLFVVEDAAQAIDSYYKGKPLGSLGDLGTFSFHETKNIISGEGGMLTVNNPEFVKRSEIIWEKGTNRSAFWRGEVDKYGWVDVGSSYLPSEIVAAFLWAQIENLETIQNRRKEIWATYWDGLQSIKEKGIQLPFIPPYATNNAHMFYLVCKSLEQRTALIEHLKKQGINAVFHYLSLHKSPYYKSKHDGRALPQSDRYEDCLVRLPFYFELTEDDQQRVIDEVLRFFN